MKKPKAAYNVFATRAVCKDCQKSRMVNKYNRCCNCQSAFQQEMEYAEGMAYGNYKGRGVR